MGIVDEDIARVRAASDIVAVVTQHTQLRKVGQRWSGLCPFHNEKSPSFSVNAQEGLYYCFGCQASGDIITFVREIEHLDFVGAVEWLAGKAGIALTYTDDNEREQRKQQSKLFGAMERAVDWYHDRLVSGVDAGAARAYLRSRGFDRDMVEAYRLGWAPDSWDDMVRSLRLPVDVATETGLAFLNRRQRLQDFFRSVVLFPIFDDRGRPVAFGGRKLPDTEGPKYKNSREGPLYNKSRTLYGLNWAKADVVASGEAVVCEGYTDVIGCFRAGIPRAVATCGTSLTEDHIISLKRFTNRVVLAYDADDAGQAAAARVYAWEQRHGLEFAVASMPAGSDPDELSRDDPDALAAALRDARPFLAFRLGRVRDAATLSTPEGRAKATEAALSVIAEHPSPLVRDQYLMEVAGFARVDEAMLRQRLDEVVAAGASNPTPTRGRGRDRDRGARRGGDADEPPPWIGRSEVADVDAEMLGGSGGALAGAARRGTGRGGADIEPAELEALRLLIQHPAGFAEELRPVLFGDLVARRAFDALGATEGVPAAIERLETAGDETATRAAVLLRRVVVEDATAEPIDLRLRLVELAARRAIGGLEREARLDDNPLGWAPVIGWLNLQVDDLRGDNPPMETVDELLAWLDEHVGEVE
jgi:DNA primase